MTPDVAPEAAEWWDATRRRVLLLQSCSSCGHRQHYPRAMCLECGCSALSWVEATGEAIIYSLTVSHRSPAPEEIVPPYVIGLVDLAEGPRMLTRLVADPDDPPRCGERVEVEWMALADGRHLPLFRPSDKKGSE